MVLLRLYLSKILPQYIFCCTCWFSVRYAYFSLFNNINYCLSHTHAGINGFSFPRAGFPALQTQWDGLISACIAKK